jgi:HlyD family secretion protein
MLRGPHYIVAALLMTLILAASVLRVDRVVAASGRLVPDGPPIVLQPLDRSVIHEIRVKIGDVVHKGDVVATLDATFTQADRASLTQQQAILQVLVRRLEAELAGTKFPVGDGTAEELLQYSLWQQRQQQYASKLDGFDAEIARNQNALRAGEESRALLTRELAIAREIEQMRADLFQRETGSRLNYLEAQATRMRAEHDTQDLVSHQADLQQTLRAAQAARAEFVESWRRDLLEDLGKARADLARLTENLAKAVRLNDLVVLTAPEDGIVLDVAKRSVGSVLHEAEPLVTLIPSGTPLIAEVMIESGDVGYTKAGDEAVIKVEAFPYQRHGLLHGRLRAIGEDSFSSAAVPGASNPSAPTTAGVYHRSQITFDPTELHDMPEGARLIPGMTCTAEIKVGTRTVLSYIIYPLSRGLRESIREP